jgi:hypothetical protein
MRSIAVLVLTGLAVAGLLAASLPTASAAEGVCESVECSVPKALFWLERYAQGEAPGKREKVQADLQRLAARCRVGDASRAELLRLAEIMELAAGLAQAGEKRRALDHYELGFCAVMLREAAGAPGQEAPGPTP